MLALGLALAALIGLALGMLGGGGSILTVPVLVYVLGYPAKPAIAMSLPIVGVTSLVGAAFHWRLGNVRLRTAALFGVLTMLGSYSGAKVAVHVSDAAQLALLALAILGAALSMLRGGPAATSDGERRTPPTAPSAPKAGALPLLVAAALGVGALTGLVGIGGGFLVVPALALLARVPMRQAVGTSLLVIAMNCASGFVGYLAHTEVAWDFLVPFTAMAVLGVLGGSVAASRVPQAALRRGFAIFLLAIGGFVLYRNRGVFAGRAWGGAGPFTIRNPPGSN